MGVRSRWSVGAGDTDAAAGTVTGTAKARARRGGKQGLDFVDRNSTLFEGHWLAVLVK